MALNYKSTPIIDSDGQFQGTVESQKTVKKIVSEMGNRIPLAFSRGKDSLAAWLYLVELGCEVYPFHCASVPHLEIVDKSLAYYEDWFDTKIERLCSGDNIYNITSLIFQPIEDLELLLRLDPWEWPVEEAGIMYAEDVLGIENPWVAQGYSMYDSVFRMMPIYNSRGIIESRDSFYPIWDWTSTQVTDFISQYDISLCLDYLVDRTSMVSVPLYTTVKNLRHEYPKDYEKMKLFFPFMDAIEARMIFRERHHKEAEDRLKNDRPKKRLVKKG